MAANPNNVALMIRADFQNPTFRQEIRASLPGHVDLAKFERVILTAIQSSNMLMQCDRRSLLRACLEAAADGLLPDGREGAIVPFRNMQANKVECTWMPMVWGLVKLVRNSGELKSIGAEIVRSADKFDRWIDEEGPHFKHQPALDGSGDPIGVYAYALTKDGGVYIEYVTWAEIQKFKRVSKAKNGPWNDWPEEMAKVRAIKRLCKRLPMSTDVELVIERDEDRQAKLAGEQVAAGSNPIAALNDEITGATPALGHDPAETVEQAVGTQTQAVPVDREPGSDDE